MDFFGGFRTDPAIRQNWGGNCQKVLFNLSAYFGNAVLVIPERNTVAVRMLNQTVRNPAGYDYVRDIQTFGNMVLKCVLSLKR